ncbi:hypothetical protein [Mesobacillus subterraneus]|uniref:SPOR domain-containing protein n=1 Tax=Mesobacillus subterraneus TaxID=285983 RepID=A0A427TI46_9BACI|nr:hypothetical protein [Mesobacillus subterraneus]RSD23311.1 hypothetical protein EJA10_20280 [Mesobacillus subterraneus]
MDKQGKTITIKINGKDRPLMDERESGSAAAEKSPKDEIKSNVYPINIGQENKSKVYPIDRDEAIKETAAAQEQAEDHFDWILPDPVEEEIVKEYKVAPKQPKKQKKKGIGISVWNTKIKRNNRLFTTIFVTVFFAVLLGTAFGVTILKFVTADSQAVTPVSTPPAAAPSEEKPAAGSESVELKPISVFIIQNGIWGTEEAAKEGLNLLTGQGVKGELFPVNGKFAVYVGTAGSIEAAKQQAKVLEAKGVKVFAKPFEIPGGTAAGLTADEAKFLQPAPEIYSILIDGGGASPEAVKKVEEYHTMISKIADKNVKDKSVLKAKASIERASGTFLSYQKTKDANQLAEMESGLLSFLAAYQSIGK